MNYILIYIKNNKEIKYNQFFSFVQRIVNKLF